MDYRETALCFECEGATLFGVLTLPAARARIGVVVVVGGPQYRVGSHRQFVLLARALAMDGVACLRFDYRGMGDSEGEPITFESAGPDITAAIDELCNRLSNLETVVLWGLCDGATACAFAAGDRRIGGLILVNPWVRTVAESAKVMLRRYYLQRLLERELWHKLWTGRIDFRVSLRSFVDTLRRFARTPRSGSKNENERETLPARFARGIARHRGPVLVVLSGNDHTAAEFRLATKRAGALKNAMERPSVTCVELPDADHTLSAARWRDEAVAITISWLRSQLSVTAAGTA